MPESDSMPPRRPVPPLVWLALFVAGCMAFGMALLCGGLSLAGISVIEVIHERIGGPGVKFHRVTGLDWPATTKVISEGDDHGGFLGDGEYHLVFDTDRATLDAWLAAAPPWNQSAWQRGPVPAVIGSHALFGMSGLGMSINADGTTEYSGDGKLKQLYTSPQIWYVAEERCCPTLHWHNGNMLIIDLTNNRVWLSVWDN